MRIHTINLASKGLAKVNKKLYHANIAIIGLAYKKDIDDVRESPAHGIIEELVNLGAYVKVYDPYVSMIRTDAGDFISVPSLEEVLAGADCAVFLVDHTIFTTIDIVKESKVMTQPVIVDTRNLFNKNDDIIYIGLGKS